MGEVDVTKGTAPPNPTLQLLFQRGSCRDYADRPVPPEVLEQVLEAGVHAATAGNLQPYSIIQVEDQATRRTLAELCGRQQFIARAPVNLLFCIDWHRLERWAELLVAPYTSASSFRNFWLSFQDVIICAQSISTAADSLGLGSVYVGTVLECFTELREMFELPDKVLPVVLLCLGYPAKKPQPAGKLGVDVVVHRERYREPDERRLVEVFNEKYRGRELEITDQRLERIAAVCREVHGEEFARRCIERIRADGRINMAQYYFGLHYCANELPKGNEEFVRRMEDFGFDWFKQYRPPGDRAT